MKFKLLSWILATIAFVLSAPALAHHAFAAEFDGAKPFDLQGEVTRIKWVNPHSWLYFDVKSSDGTVINWGVELTTPNQLLTRGLTRTDITIGSVIRIRGFRSRNGGPFGYSVFLTLPDGRNIQTG